jgi:hypothetical protein
VTRRIVAQPALARFQPEEFKPGVQFQSDEELARLAGDIATTIFHPVGTTKMGRADDPMAVLDADALRVRRPDPRPARGRRRRHAHHHQRQHQLSPTLMMAEKAARWIAKPDSPNTEFRKPLAWCSAAGAGCSTSGAGTVGTGPPAARAAIAWRSAPGALVGLLVAVSSVGQVGVAVFLRLGARKAHDLHGVFRVGRHPFGVGHTARLAAQQHMQVRCHREFFTDQHGAPPGCERWAAN